MNGLELKILLAVIFVILFRLLLDRMVEIINRTKNKNQPKIMACRIDYELNLIKEK